MSDGKEVVTGSSVEFNVERVRRDAKESIESAREIKKKTAPGTTLHEIADGGETLAKWVVYLTELLDQQNTRVVLLQEYIQENLDD